MRGGSGCQGALRRGRCAAARGGAGAGTVTRIPSPPPVPPPARSAEPRRATGARCPPARPGPPVLPPPSLPPHPCARHPQPRPAVCVCVPPPDPSPAAADPPGTATWPLSDSRLWWEKVRSASGRVTCAPRGGRGVKLPRLPLPFSAGGGLQWMRNTDPRGGISPRRGWGDGTPVGQRPGRGEKASPRFGGVVVCSLLPGFIYLYFLGVCVEAVGIFLQC